MLLSHRHTPIKTKQSSTHFNFTIRIALCGFEVAFFYFLASRMVQLHITRCPLLVMLGTPRGPLPVSERLSLTLTAAHCLKLLFGFVIMSSGHDDFFDASLTYSHLFRIKVWSYMGGDVSAISLSLFFFITSPFDFACQSLVFVDFWFGKKWFIFFVWLKTSSLVVTLKDDWRHILQLRCVKLKLLNKEFIN